MAERKEPPAGQVYLKNVRLSFEHVWVKTASVEDGPKKFRANFLIDPSTSDGKKNIKLCEDAVEAVKEALWHDKADKIVIKEDRMAFLEGDKFTNQEGDVYEGYDGMYAVKASNGKRVDIRDRDGETKLEEEDDKIYSGAYVCAIVRFYAIKDKAKGGNGVFASLEGIQYYKKGDKFSGGGVSDEDFQNHGEEDDDDDSGSKKDKGKGKDKGKDKDKDDKKKSANPEKAAKSFLDTEDSKEKKARKKFIAAVLEKLSVDEIDEIDDEDDKKKFVKWLSKREDDEDFDLDDE